MEQKYCSLGQTKRSWQGILIKCYGIGLNTAVSRANTLLIADTKVLSANTLVFWANRVIFCQTQGYLGPDISGK